jgi:hypothetical protein
MNMRSIRDHRDSMGITVHQLGLVVAPLAPAMTVISGNRCGDGKLQMPSVSIAA